MSTLSSVVIGRSAWDIEALWQRMYRFMYYNGMGGVVLAAISGIDMALYDIVGKKLGVPVYKILGGQVHEKLRTYANGWTDGLAHTPEAYAARTKELVARGYTGCKLDPFFVTPMNREVTQPDVRLAASLVRAIREAGGPDYDIAIDVHSFWNTKSTLEIIRALEPYRLFFYEEAVPPENVAVMAEVQRNTQTPSGDRRADLRSSGLPPIAGTAGGAHHPARCLPHGRHHGGEEDCRDGRYVFHSCRAAQSERTAVHAGDHASVLLDPELPDPGVLREGRTDLPGAGPRRL